MKTLRADIHNGTFRLDGVDIGDYLEAELISDLGVIDKYVSKRDPNVDVAVAGYELLLTFSANHSEPEIVLLQLHSCFMQHLHLYRKPGEQLVLTMCRNQMRFNGKVVATGKAFLLLVNGEKLPDAFLRSKSEVK